MRALDLPQVDLPQLSGSRCVNNGVVRIIAYYCVIDYSFFSTFAIFLSSKYIFGVEESEV